MSKNKKKENKQELMIELKTLDDELKKLNTHLENMNEQIAELNDSKHIVNKFSELKKQDEIRVPLSSGIYIKASISDTKNLMINVGGNVTVEKTPKQVIEILDSQLTELSGYRDQLIGQMQTIIARIEEIQSDFEG
jgi:prefoldin alpha subunit